MQDYKRNSLLLLLLAVVAAVVGVEGLTIRSEGSSSKVSSSKVSSVMSTPLRRSRDALEEHPSDAKYIVIFEPRWQFPDTWDEALKRLEPLKVVLEPAKESLLEALEECKKINGEEDAGIIDNWKRHLKAFYQILDGEKDSVSSPVSFPETELKIALDLLQLQPRDQMPNFLPFIEARNLLALPKVEMMRLPSHPEALLSDSDLQNELRMGWKDVVVELKSLVAKSKTELSGLKEVAGSTPNPSNHDHPNDLFVRAGQRELVYDNLIRVMDKEGKDAFRNLFLKECSDPGNAIRWGLMSLPTPLKTFYSQHPEMFKSMLEEANLIQRTWAKSTWDINWIVPPNRK
eukprot:Filipodium_phascolosomae@DN2354_c0_g1_i3.p1